MRVGDLVEVRQEVMKGLFIREVWSPALVEHIGAASFRVKLLGTTRELYLPDTERGRMWR